MLGLSYDVQRLAGSGIPDENGDGVPDAPPADLRWIVPTDGVYGASYAQGVVAGGPHPNGGRLWIEHMLSLDTAALLLDGGAVPARLESSGRRRNGRPLGARCTHPDRADRHACSSPRPEQVAAALEVVVENWGPMVADVPTASTAPGRDRLTRWQPSPTVRTLLTAAPPPICRAARNRGLRFRP